ncbi:MAG: hypothetical protein AAF718_13975 [Pseudomonadota bacterium]
MKSGVISVLGLWGGLQPAVATPSLCVFTAQCDNARVCGEASFEIRWLHAEPREIWLNGMRFQAKRYNDDTLLDETHTAGTGVEIRSEGPMIIAQKGRQLVFVVHRYLGSEIVVTMFEMPKRYVEYKAAMRDRSVYRGACEGLF